MSKDAFYFPHDYHARDDRKWSKLIRERGYRAYGLGWAVIERLYEEEGRLPDDEEQIAYELRLDPAKDSIEDLRAVLASDLFYRRDGFIGSESVDRRRSIRDEIRKAAVNAGKASAMARAQRTLNDRSAEVQPERKEKEKKEIKEKTTAPSAVDYSGHRLQCGAPGGFKDVYVVSLTPEACERALSEARPNKTDEAALRWWIAQKRGEGAGMSKKPVVQSAGDLIRARGAEILKGGL